MKKVISIITIFVMIQFGFMPARCVLTHGPKSQIHRIARKTANPFCWNRCSGYSAGRRVDGERRRKDTACLICPADITAKLPEPTFDDDFASRQFLHREFGDALWGAGELHVARRAYLSVRDPVPIALRFVPMLC